VIADLKPYPAMKDSGVPWLGDVPEHWEVRRAKFLMREVDERSTTGEEELMSVSHKTGVTSRRQKSVTMFLAESNVGHKVCRPGDVVVNTMWAWMAALGVSKQTGIVSPSYGVYRLRRPDQFLQSFLDELLRIPMYRSEYVIRSTGITGSRLRLYPDAFLRIPMLRPEIAEQSGIIRFLDHADRRIRRYVRAKQKLIKLLEEQKQAIIHRAVTRGLGPNVRLKRSGVAWLGDVPEHWQIAELVRLTTRIGDGLHGTPEYVDESEYHFINGNNLSGGAIRITPSTRCVSEVEFERYNIALDDSTVLMSINGTIGNVAFYRGESLVLGKSAAYIKCSKSLARSFLFFFLQSSSAREFFQLELTGTTIFNLSLASIRNLLVALPPLTEQIEISCFLDNKMTEFDDLINRAQREISLLRQYRIRLIADVVTGKLDVREAAARLPEEVEGPEPLGEADALSDVEEDTADDLDEAPEEAEA